MTDLIQDVQDVIKKWETKSAPNRGRMRNTPNRYNNRRQYVDRDSSLSNFSRSLQQRDYKRTYVTKNKYDNLADFKMAPTVAAHQKARPFVGIPCARCFPHSKANIEDETVYLLGVINILHIPYFSVKSFDICCFRNLLKIYSLTYNTSEGILTSKRVENAIQLISNSEEQGEISEILSTEALHQKARTILKDLKSSISTFCVEVTAVCLDYVLKRLFSGIFVHKGQTEILKNLCKDNIPFVYLPLYRSYFDYILISYILHRNSLNLPFATVTDNLQLPLLGYIFRVLGAIYIKKDVLLKDSQSDLLYDAVVKSYIINCLQAGHSVELFLETQRSTSGKPEIPETNLLSAILESVSEGLIEDVYVVPVSISYENIEGNFVAEQLRTSSKEEASIFSKLCSIWRIMHFKYGNVRANFNQPFSIKEFLQSNNKQYQLNYNYSCDTFVPNSLNKESMSNKNNAAKSPVTDLAVHAFYDATTCTSLMSTHLLAFLLVTQYRKGGTQQQLQNSMDWLRGEILYKKCDVGFAGESLPVIKRAVELLGKELISIESIEMEWTSSDLENNNLKFKVYTPVVKLPHVLELQYYANAVVPLFLKESIIVNAIYAMVDVDICHFHHCDSRFHISRDSLVQTAVTLSDFLKYEFITVLPCEDIVSAFNDTIDKLIDKECLSMANMHEGYMKSKKRRDVLSFDACSDEEDFEEVEQQLKIDLKEETISYLEFLRNILSPYIESYWLAACSLLKLIDEVMEESTFIKEIQMTAQEKLYKGLLAYEESFSAQTLKNSLKMFYDRQIIEYDCENNIKTIYLTETYNSFESVHDIIAIIEDFRK